VWWRTIFIHRRSRTAADNNSCRQVEVVVLAANLEVILAADEGEPLPEFQNQQSKMLY
jgi:hypothetical protein